MALVVFYTHGPHSVCSVRRSAWTKNFDRFLEWLSEINFCAGGLGEAAIAEGLSEALMMLAPGQAVTQMAQEMDRQKHCVLVAASNPFPLATPVPRPSFHASCQQWVADAETVAKAYAQCSVSLSVIVPKQLPKLISVFNAAQHKPSATDTVRKNIKHSHHLVLLSDSFACACSALRYSGATPVNSSPNLIKTDSTSAAIYSVPLQPQTTATRPSSSQAVDGVMSGYVHAPNSELATETVKMVQGHGVDNSSMGDPQLPSTITASQQLVTGHAKCTKVWEGMLVALKQKKPVYICKLEAYRKITSPKILAADWPTSMQIDKVISHEDIDKHYEGKTEYLIFRPMSQHSLLLKLSERKLTAVIRLPTQILFLSSSDQPGLMIGMLLPKENVVDTPEPPNQPHMQQQPPPPQQQLQPQQLQKLLKRPQQQQQPQQQLHPQKQQQQQELQKSLTPLQEQQPQGLPSAIGQSFVQREPLDQTRPQLISQGQFQCHGPASVPVSSALQQQQQPQGIPSAIGQPFVQTQTFNQLRPHNTSQSQFQGHGPAILQGTGGQQQRQQQPQEIRSGIERLFILGEPSSQARPQGQFQGHGPANMPGADAQQQQQQPQGVASGTGQSFVQSRPHYQIRPEFISQGQFQHRSPASIPEASAQQQGQQPQGIPSASWQPFSQSQRPNQTR